MIRAAFLILLLSSSAATAQSHHCAKDAAAKALALLKLHYSQDEPLEQSAIEEKVKTLPPIKAIKGKGRFDVVEVWGHIYKADYRMRFIYAQRKEDCVLMGQEILEASDPY